ncbi:het domain-containing protein [Paraphaeosphaeria minitans]|uniref:Het domain-containing protein n=1 Tax=Paraphaeosphaeria minitans TaxID=565426 RepID=A0A9P6G759_9PLEO|nr:het domain-containing protein [Paraphaeosphaeria minitans]
MRLLQLKGSGDVRVTRDFIKDVPTYAILSHTWGSDEEELAFQELSTGQLSEAINSMFNWYRDAKICFVYLADVNRMRLGDLDESRWFKRGWTL